jgi:1-acyl-sn-glycerol-3-phosphate acyltransferase
MRAKIHPQIETFGKTSVDRKAIREEVREVVYSQLMEYDFQLKGIDNPSI